MLSSSMPKLLLARRRWLPRYTSSPSVMLQALRHDAVRNVYVLTVALSDSIPESSASMTSVYAYTASRDVIPVLPSDKSERS